MIEPEEMNIDELVEDIIGRDQTSDPESKVEYPYVLKCKTCGLIFGAKTRGTQFCPRCRQKARHDGGKKGAEKAARLRGETMERKINATAVPVTEVPPQRTPDSLDADIRSLAAHQAEICDRHNLTPGQVAEAVTILIHYRNVLDRLFAESDDPFDL